MEKENQQNKSERAVAEEAVLSFWKENNIFEKTLKKDSPEGDFVFYEGPPTANAKPALHHLEARAFKDVIPRYKTMRGFSVR
ncbi:class I tRNA ligase family protein, partial [Candidatus Nomurabacteria bacterium]|nr:class I tRNA ligase family protein [Candidatus Nomurabacteria bacterium]